jgi:FtsP/CotA-like multicopper oxidase with cupredoxin domain
MRAHRRLLRTAVLAGGLVIALLFAAATPSRSSSSWTPSEYAEPVVLKSQDGVLEVMLFARQGKATLDTVATPVHNFLLFGYEVRRGTASNGERSASNLYPGPTLQVAPGETLIVHVVNELADLTIRDFCDPAFTPRDRMVALEPPQLTSAPFNLHTHGLHVSPKGNSDNVLLDIPAGYTNTYTYRIPSDHPQGVYWYHSHRHTVTAQSTYLGLAGMLLIGRADGAIPVVEKQSIPVRTMALQYNFVPDRLGGGSILANPSWPQNVSTLVPPKGTELADGTYVPSLAPVQFWQSAPGTQFFTIWWAGLLTPDNHRGQLQFVPLNLQSFRGRDGGPNVPVDLALPDHLRDVQYTVNGLFQPVLRAAPGQTEIWILANMSDFTYMTVTLTETATGKHPVIPIVGQDGNPFLQVQNPTTNGGTTLAIPPGSRYAIAVTMPSEGDLVLEMPSDPTLSPISADGILYTSNGTKNAPAVLGTVEIATSELSYFDGFFAYPTQVLARVEPAAGTGATTPFPAGQALGAHTSFVDLAKRTPDWTRKLVVSGGIDNEHANRQDSQAFLYEFDDNTFPNTPLLQPRLGTVEEWSFVNYNNDEHPIHIHVNDFQVTSMIDPVRKSRIGVQLWGEDNANLPAPTLGSNMSVLEAGTLSLRTEFLQFTGPYVIHCHRLNHEDNGLMAMVNVIPAISSFAVASPGAPGQNASVRIYDGAAGTKLAAVEPFPSFTGDVSVAMGDVDGDQVLDLVAGKGPGGPPEVVVYSGAGGTGAAPFAREIVRFLAFDPSFSGGVTVAAAGIDGNEFSDNVIVASGAGMESTVKVFGSTLPSTTHTAPDVFASFSPYPGSKSGVEVAAGLVDSMSGRSSIVTAPGVGEPSTIKTFRFDLFRPNEGAAAWCAPRNPLPPGVPLVTSEFAAFDPGYTGGVSLSTGWITGAWGGAKSIVVSQTAGPGLVKVFSSGSGLDGEPAGYLRSPSDHETGVTFHQIARFSPFEDAPASGVRVATTSTVQGADVLVSGLDAAGAEVRVRKYGLERAEKKARDLTPKLLSEVGTFPGTTPISLGGD